jgi:hypothetical protein
MQAPPEHRRRCRKKRQRRRNRGDFHAGLRQTGSETTQAVFTGAAGRHYELRFPMGMISRHWGRMADTWRTGERYSAVGYGAALITSTTLLGALARSSCGICATGKTRAT